MLFNHGLYQRYGQILASFLPRDFNDEKPISLYDQSPPTVRRGGELIDGIYEDNSLNKETEPGMEDEVAAIGESRSKIRRRIRLRNHLFDVLMSHLTTETNQFDTKYVIHVYVHVHVHGGV